MAPTLNNRHAWLPPALLPAPTPVLHLYVPVRRGDVADAQAASSGMMQSLIILGFLV